MVQSLKKMVLYVSLPLLLVHVTGCAWNRPVSSIPTASTTTGGQTTQTSTATIREKLSGVQAVLDELVKTDQDLDGLTDAQEQKYGTSSAAADTDNDGLLDKDEIMIYHTDPLKSDTDADGYSDGNEVWRGYNPNGPGKLKI